MFGSKLKKEIFIEGMTCNHCKMKVEEALKKQKEVKEAKVDLREKKAEILLNKDITDEKIKEIIEDLGYEVTKIEE